MNKVCYFYLLTKYVTFVYTRNASATEKGIKKKDETKNRNNHFQYAMFYRGKFASI